MGFFDIFGKQEKTSQINQFLPSQISFMTEQAQAAQRLLPFQESFQQQLLTLPGQIAPGLQQALQTGVGERALPELTGRAFEGVQAAAPGLARQLGGNIQGITDIGLAAGAPFDQQAILSPLIQAFREQIAPEIRSSALRVGAPGGSTEQELFRRASRSFSTAGTEALSRAELQRRQVGIQGGQLAQGAQSLLPMILQILGQGGQAFLAGPQAQAGLDVTERGLATQRETTPLDLLLRASGGGGQGSLSGIGPIQPLQLGQQQETKTGTAQNIGTAISTAALIAAFASDRRLKEDIEFAFKFEGLNWYTFRYLWDNPVVRRLGVMAQEVLDVVPEAVYNVEGYLYVDYRRLLWN